MSAENTKRCWLQKNATGDQCNNLCVAYTENGGSSCRALNALERLARLATPERPLAPPPVVRMSGREP